MDYSERDNNKKKSDVIPLVPIKTYKWEDIRRARRRGGYPWTYLYKEKSEETRNPEVFRMDGLKKSKISSASSASDSLDIKEITEDDVKGLEGIDSSYVVIESPILLGRRIEPQIEDPHAIVESADSSDNISQYLEKEDIGLEQELESTETLTLPTPNTTKENQEKHTKRAKSEEPNRKKKLSMESNYSRVSLSKSNVIRRLKNAKEKVRLPKFVFKTRTESKIEAEIAERPIEKPEHQCLSTETEKPLYIHIPLKPPEGEKDEFSHLEFEEKPPNLPAVVQMKVTEENDNEKNGENSFDEAELTPIAEKLNGINLGFSVPNDQEDDVSAIIFLDDEEGCIKREGFDIIAVDIDRNCQETKMSQIVNTEVCRQVLENIEKVESQPDSYKNIEDSSVNLGGSSSQVSKTSKLSVLKKRAKSAEPGKQRRGSIDSSYSRKSLSKIGLLKKLKQCHFPLVKTKKSITDSRSEKIDIAFHEEVSRKEVHNEELRPVYIHIPLKPPQEQTDQFSQLEFDAARPPPPKIEKDDTTEYDMSAIDTPQSFEGPQFILLTPSSDDELLDIPEIPDTPFSESGNIFQLGELQQLEKKVVDEIQGPLESLIEEIDKENTLQATVDTSYENGSEEEKDPRNEVKLTIDEEDGLKSNPSTNLDVKANFESNKKAEYFPSSKKRVSFKRRKSSQASRDYGYEEIESPTYAFGDDNDPDMKNQKQKETTSFEENNRWSKLSDHEYEPVNPLPEERTETTPSKFHVSEALNPSNPKLNDEFHSSVKEIQFELAGNVSNKQSTSPKLVIDLNVESENSPSSNFHFPSSLRSTSREKGSVTPKKFQTAIMEGATKFKRKLQEMKKPSISMPSFRKPNFDSPKLKDITSTFRRIPKRDIEAREMGIDSSSNSKVILDFSTYPRLFKKKKKQDRDSVSLREDNIEKVGKTTWPVRKSEVPEIIRIPLHSEESMDQENGSFPQPEEILEVGPNSDTNDASSLQRYHEDTEADDEDTSQKENQGRLRGALQQNESFETNHYRDLGSSGSSLSQHRQGVLEEIDSDQFFLRVKGISQDNIDVGKYLSFEIREAFRSPTDALTQIHSYNDEVIRASNQSLPDMKIKLVKKSKRRKTPHTSKEQLRNEPGSEKKDYIFMPPIRPKRKSRRRKQEFDTVPFFETIPLTPRERMEKSLDDEEGPPHYENDQIKDGQIIESYNEYKLHAMELHDAHRRASEPTPAAPPRKHKSLKSLNASEHDSIFQDHLENDEINTMKGEIVSMKSDIMQPSINLEIPKEICEAPARSPSKMKSVSRISPADRESVLGEMDSIFFNENFGEPVVEEPFIKDLRDSMGYAIVDKNQNKNWEHKFCTISRSQGCSERPERPLRNYSTLGPRGTARKLSRNMTDEDKENIDISKYIEADGERDLQSGEIIQKIQNRPLPAPPRPPRSKSKSLGDAKSKFNIEDYCVGDLKCEDKYQLDEIEVSTQTEPLPPDFQFEEMIHDETDKMMTPLASRKSRTEKSTDIHILSKFKIKDEIVLDTPKEFTEETITHGQLLVEPINGARILSEPNMSNKKNFSMTNDDCEISNVPEFFNNLSEPIDHAEDDTKTENFLDRQEEFDERFNEELELNKLELNKLDQGSANVETNTETSKRQLDTQKTLNTKTMRSNYEEPQRPTALSQKNESLELLKIQKLDVTDLDVEKLIVNELIANKIIISEIESSNISTNKITSTSGTSSLELQPYEPDAVRKLLEKWEDSPEEQHSGASKRKVDVITEDKNVLETSFGQASSIIPISLASGYVDSTPSQYSEINNDISIDQKPISENSNDILSLPNEHCRKLSQNREDFGLGFGIHNYSQSAEYPLVKGVSNIENSSNNYTKSKSGKNISNSEPISFKNSDTTKQFGSFEHLLKETPKENISNQEMQDTNYEVMEQSVQKSMWNSDDDFETSSNFGDEYERNISLLSNEKFEEASDNRQSPARLPRCPDKKPIASETRSAEDGKLYSESRNSIQKLKDVKIKTERSCNIPDSPQFQLIEPDVDDELPSRPPHVCIFSVSSNELYAPSRDTNSSLRKQYYAQDLPEESPLVSNRKHCHRSATLSESSSEPSIVRISKRKGGSPELSIPHLIYQLIRGCSIVARHKLNSLIHGINSKVSNDVDADNNKEIVQVLVVVLLILIAVLLLMNDRKTIHLHHWEYFNPPTDL
ncbi:uncharacterized protein LOC123315586 isoform X2 [Coccinella septempunctata]|uniref:uncharacterized protein LOC123315586 isoform X2 n=1 Tax=Coccinella septempunctata TaxID=41139 RepID=UPI001D0991AD|nr:uncharacterized protein LOC123315586 isoform X2 [Coccinella septempunctata]